MVALTISLFAAAIVLITGNESAAAAGRGDLITADSKTEKTDKLLANSFQRVASLLNSAATAFSIPDDANRLIQSIQDQIGDIQLLTNDAVRRLQQINGQTKEQVKSISNLRNLILDSKIKFKIKKGKGLESGCVRIRRIAETNGPTSGGPKGNHQTVESFIGKCKSNFTSIFYSLLFHLKLILASFYVIS